jgi:hypothetical protein
MDGCNLGSGFLTLFAGVLGWIYGRLIPLFDPLFIYIFLIKIQIPSQYLPVPPSN